MQEPKSPFACGENSVAAMPIDMDKTKFEKLTAPTFLNAPSFWDSKRFSRFADKCEAILAEELTSDISSGKDKDNVTEIATLRSFVRGLCVARAAQYCKGMKAHVVGDDCILRKSSINSAMPHVPLCEPYMWETISDHSDYSDDNNPIRCFAGYMLGDKTVKPPFIMLPQDQVDHEARFVEHLLPNQIPMLIVKTAALQYLKRIVRYTEIDESNFISKAEPRSKTERSVLVTDFFWACSSITERLMAQFSFGLGVIAVNDSYKNTKQQLWEDIRGEVESEMTALRKDKDRMLSEIRQLRMSDVPSAEDLNRMMEANLELSRKLNKLQRMLDDTEEKRRLAVQRADELEAMLDEEDVAEENEVDNALDPNDEYVFALDRWDHEGSTIRRFQEAFPKSVFTDNETIITPQTKLVIILTKYIKHFTMYRIVNRCRSNGVPYKFVKYANPDRLIATGLNNGYFTGV